MGRSAEGTMMEVRTHWVVVVVGKQDRLVDFVVPSNVRPDWIANEYRRKGFTVYLGRRDA
jgi:hypothetical protein